MSLSASRAIRDELLWTQREMLTAVRVKVTARAIRGSVVALPFGKAPHELEVLVHPDDWLDVLREVPPAGCMPVTPQFAYGLPVMRGAMA